MRNKEGAYLRREGRTYPLVSVIVLLLAVCVTAAWAGVTYYPNGVYVGEKGDATPGVTPGNDDVYVEGTLEVDGAARFDGAVSFNSTMTFAGTKRIWLEAINFGLPGSEPASLADEGSFKVLKFADATTDDHAWLSIMWPADCDESIAASMYFVYCLDANASETEGEWNAKAALFVDGAAVSAAATQLTTVHDTPQDNLKLNITSAMPIPAALINASGVTNIDLYHRVDDPFGDEAMLVGVYIEYTSDKP